MLNSLVGIIASSGSSGTITFSSIPSTYVALQVRAIARNTSADTTAGAVRVRLNGSSATDYTYHRLSGDGASATATGSATGGTSGMFIESAVAGGGQTASTVGAFIFDLHNYASSTQYKTARTFAGVNTNAGSTADSLALVSNLWIQTTAVTSLSFISTSGNWTTDTVIALYGIKGA
jgi:hypothetical protein